MRRRVRIALGVVAGLVVVAGVLLAGLTLWERGPGFERELHRFAELVALKPGMVLADVGAGKGRMAVAIAKRVAPTGRVYATEIEEGLRAAIRSRAAEEGADNLTVLEAGERSTNLPPACCDVIYLRRVYHHLSEPAGINQSLFTSLRPGGRLVIIDFLTPGWMFFMRHGMGADIVIRQVTEAGFDLERRIDRWSGIDYCLVFKRGPDS